MNKNDSFEKWFNGKVEAWSYILPLCKNHKAKGIKDALNVMQGKATAKLGCFSWELKGHYHTSLSNLPKSLRKKLSKSKNPTDKVER